MAELVDALDLGSSSVRSESSSLSEVTNKIETEDRLWITKGVRLKAPKGRYKVAILFFFDIFLWRVGEIGKRPSPQRDEFDLFSAEEENRNGGSSPSTATNLFFEYRNGNWYTLCSRETGDA